MLKKTLHLKFSIELKTDIQTLYDFHTDTDNLPKITPPWLAVKIISLEKPLIKGSQVELDIGRFGMTQRWKIKIVALNPPELVCDRALKSSFSSFVHYHRFKTINEYKSLLCDELELTLPFYPFSLIALPFIKKDIQKMFDYRHLQTKKILEKNYV